jgi:L-alanine-DL-glutamate epimerase-like enolase superfamily enzyme
MATLRVQSHRLRLRTPLRTAWGELRVREVLTVRLNWSDGDYGIGEAAPLEAYDGVSTAAVRAALDAYGEVLRRMPAAASHTEILAACAAERPLPQALAAVDLALWDRAGRAAGKPVATLITPRAARAVEVNATISAADPIFAAAEAYRAATAGYRCVKVKIGVGDDAARIAAVRHAIGPTVAIRVDANGAWRDPEEALERLRDLVDAGIELAEEPVHGLAALSELRIESPIPIAMDETAAEVSDGGWAAADVICLKISRCGGITGLIEQAHSARRAGAQVFVGSTFDGPVGIAAGVHAAAVLAASGPLPACGLATLGMFLEHAHILPVDNGQIQVPSEAGLLGTTTRVK